MVRVPDDLRSKIDEIHEEIREEKGKYSLSETVEDLLWGGLRYFGYKTRKRKRRY